MFNNTLRVIMTVISILILVLGAQTLLIERISWWGGTSMTVSLVLLLITTVTTWHYRRSYLSIATYLYSTVLVGRLFSTLRLTEDMVATDGASLDPLLLGETGPGIPYIMYLSYLLVVLIVVQAIHIIIKKENRFAVNYIGVNDWAITFLRVYVGLMFIAHYSGHVLAGADQFQVFSDYFAGVGFHIGGPMVALAGIIEITVSVGLVFGIATRLSAITAVLYLYFATLWGEHFSAGYIWVLPNGGWEFSALWMAAISIFIITGGSKVSIDRRVYKTAPKTIRYCFI